MLAGEALQLGQELLVAAEGKARLEALLDREHAQLLQPLRLGPRELVVAELPVRLPSPERERTTEDREGELRIAVPPGLRPLCEKTLETCCVERTWIQHERVAAAACLNGEGAWQRLPQLRDVDLHQLRGGRRRPPVPERLDQDVGGDRPARVDDERSQKPPVLLTGQPHRAGLADDLNRSENPYLQPRSAFSSPSSGNDRL